MIVNLSSVAGIEIQCKEKIAAFYWYKISETMSYPGKLIFILGVSGSGKNTVIREMLKTDLGLTQVISCKTRPLRPDEVDGVDYHYYTDEAFQKAVEEKVFLEHMQVYDIYWYATRKADIIDALVRGEHIIKEIDMNGLIHIAKNHTDVREVTKSIFIDIDDETMKQRIMARAPMTEDELKKRIDEADFERPLAKQYCTDVIDGSGLREEVAAHVYALIAAYVGKELTTEML